MALNLSKELKVGLFSLLTLAALYILINFLSGRDIFNKSNTYYAMYDNVEGLTQTGPVYIRGLKVGSVEAINYVQEEDKFIVRIKAKNIYAIPNNSIAEIYSADILGSKALRINMGTSRIHLQSKDTLLSAIEKGLMSVLSNEIIPVKDQLSATLISLNNTLNSINNILTPQVQEDIAAAISNFRKTMGNIESIASNIEDSNPEIKSLLENFNTLSSNLIASAQKLNTNLDNMTEITDDLKTADITGTISSLKSLLEEIRNPEGSIGKLLTTDQLHSSIDTLISDIDTLIKNITKNPKKYIKVSVF